MTLDRVVTLSGPARGWCRDQRRWRRATQIVGGAHADPAARARSRRTVPAELDVGHHRAPEVRDAHAEPVDVLPPAGGASRRAHRRRRVHERRCPRRSASASGPRTSPRRCSARRRRDRERFDADGRLELIERHRVTVLALREHPVHHDAQRPRASAERDLSSLRVMFTGGEAVPYERALAVRGAHRLQACCSSSGRTRPACSRARRSRRPRPAAAHRRPGRPRHAGAPASTGRRDVTASGRGQPACEGRRRASGTSTTTRPTPSSSTPTAGC